MSGTGFVTRSKGKSRLATLWLGEQALNGPAAIQSYTTADSLAQTIGPQSKVNILVGSSAMSVFTIGFGPKRGHDYDFIFQPTSGVMLKSTTPFDGSTNLVIKTTFAQQIRLTGISTAAWRIVAANPGSTAGVAPAVGYTLSTTT